jgi:hypothetical protein
MAVRLQRSQDQETPMLAPPGSLLSEIRHFLGGFDRATLVFWGTQVLCWLLVVAIAMLWGLRG